MTNSMQGVSTALILIDFQPHNTSQVADSTQLLSNAKRLLSICRQLGILVAHVRVAFEEDEFRRLSPHNKNLSSYKDKGSAKDAGILASLPQMQYHPDLAPISGEITVRKTRVGAFSTTNLHNELQDRGITHLVIAGISTSSAILSTVRDAIDKDYAMTVISDACADKKVEVHDFLFNIIFPKTCNILTTQEAVDSIFAP
jgi:nicotinamidase-related amidase